jgi:hypothetical protein
MHPSLRIDRYRAHSFTLELDGQPCAGFQECSIAAAPLIPCAPRLPGRIILKRGVAGDPRVRDWLQGAARRTGAIVLRDAVGVQKGRWKMTGARVVKWTGPKLNATANEVFCF